MSEDLEDLLTDAATAPSPDEARRVLRDAERLVRRPSESIQLARGWLAIDPDEARRHVEAAVRDAGLDVWTYRHAAEILGGPLDDRAAAAEALRRGEDGPRRDPLTRQPRPSYILTLLGAGWRATLGDDVSYRRCVAAARSESRTVGDLCTVAGAFDDLGDGAAAAEALTAAEAQLEADVAAGGEPVSTAMIHAHWTVAVAHDRRGDPGAAREALARAEERSTSTDGDLALARAWHGRRARDAAAPTREGALLARARQRAATVEEALAAVEATGELAGDPLPEDDVRRTLERAVALASTASHRIEIARACRRWLGDEAFAATLGPRGFRPGDVVVRRHPLDDGWPRDASGLLDHLRARLGDDALATIADADYGNDRDGHLAVLRDVRDSGLVPHPLPWVPREVLSLTQHGTGRSVDHVARAFCCALLLIEAAGPGPAGEGAMEPTLAVIGESGLAVEASRPHLLPFLVAVVEGLEEVEHLFGLLAVVIAAVAADAQDPRVEPLVRRILDEEPLAAGEDPPHPEEGFLLRTTFFDGRHALWRELIARVLVPAAGATPALRELVSRLAPAR